MRFRSRSSIRARRAQEQTLAKIKKYGHVTILEEKILVMGFQFKGFISEANAGLVALEWAESRLLVEKKRHLRSMGKARKTRLIEIAKKAAAKS